jgi:flagellar M-ring protein FliF
MNGNLLGRPRRAEPADGAGPSEATLDFRHKVEADLLNKINATLEPLLGADKYRAGVSVDCDFSGGELSEEVFDPARSVMLSSQRTEDSSGAAAASGVPGTSSTLPRPTSRPAASSGRVTRVSENITYQSSRTVKRTRLAGGTVKKMSVAILVDQELTWEKDKNTFRRVLAAPGPEKLKSIRDLVAGVTGFSSERGDQITVESLPFESTLRLEPPPPPVAAPAQTPPPKGPLASFQLNRKQLIMAAAGVAVLVVFVTGLLLLRRKSRRARPRASAPVELPSGSARVPSPDGAALAAVSGAAASAVPTDSLEAKLTAQLAERDALQQEMEAKALNALKVKPVITKTAEVLAKHLRESITKDPEVPAQILRSWIREEDS